MEAPSNRLKFFVHVDDIHHRYPKSSPRRHEVTEDSGLRVIQFGKRVTVYSARACDTDFPCAVKVLRPDWDDQPVAVKLLQREARAAFSVNHPHLVRIFEAHVMTPPYFLVMEYLAGESLRRRMRRDYRLDSATSIWVVRQMAEALAALHRKNFIHGDIKPENIRLVDTGNALLLDLGFAHRPGENAALIEKGYVLGTVNYLAPELCGDEPRDDTRADIFSLGVTLFEMLTGQLPYAIGPPARRALFARKRRCCSPTLSRRHRRR